MLNFGTSNISDITLGYDSVNGILSGSGELIYIKPWGSGMMESSFDVLSKFTTESVSYQASASGFTVAQYSQSGHGCLMPDGNIIRQNWDETRLYFLDTKTETSYTSSWVATASFKTKGMAVGQDGLVYLKNASNGQHLIRFNPYTVTSSVDSVKMVGGTQYGTSVFWGLSVGKDGNLYSLSNSATYPFILKYDPRTETTTFISASYSNYGSYPVQVSHPNGKIYFADGSGYFKSYDYTNNIFQTYSNIGTGNNIPNSMQVGPDGNIYVTTRTGGAKRIVITEDTATVQYLGTVGESIGGCFGADGRWYQIPFWTPVIWKSWDIYTGQEYSGSYPMSPVRGGGAVLAENGNIYSLGITNVNKVVKITTTGSYSTYGYLKSPIQQVGGT